MKESDDAFHTSGEMQLCTVRRSVGFTTVFEMFNESHGQFLLACVVAPNNNQFLFVKRERCHLLEWHDLRNSLTESEVLGKMQRSWLTGLRYRMYHRDGYCMCQIK